MPGNPTWLYYLLAVLMLLIAAYCLVLFFASLSTGRATGRDVEIGHAFMGVAMAGMFVPAWAFGATWFWVLAFAILLVWYVVQTVQLVQRWGTHVPHTAIHGVMAFAMLLMYWFPMGANGGMSMSMSMSMGHGGGRLDPGLAFLVAFVLLGSAIFTVASPHRGASHFGTHEPARARHAPAEGGGQATITLTGADVIIGQPVLVDATHVVMCLAMGLMLIFMI